MGAITIPPSGAVYFDANCFIYSAECIEPYRTFLESVWLAAHSRQIEIVSSELVILETLVKPLRDQNSILENRYRSLIASQEVRLIPATKAVWEEAAHLRASFNVKTPDALHAASAIVAGASLFVTNDSGFHRIANLPVCLLSDHV